MFRSVLVCRGRITYMLCNNYTTYQCCQIHVICCLFFFICCPRIVTLWWWLLLYNMLCKKFDMLCKIRQHMNCNVFFRCGLNACTLSAKNAYALVACAHMQQCIEASLQHLRTYLESCTSIVQAVVAARTTAVSTKPVTRCCSLKKSVQIHASSWHGRRCGFAQALFNHPRWCRLHPVCRSRTRAWPRSLPSTKFYFCYGFGGLFHIDLVSEHCLGGSQPERAMDRVDWLCTRWWWLLLFPATVI